MIKRLLGILMLSLALASCGEKRPDNVLDDESMESLLYDLYMTEAAITAKGGEVSDTLATEYFNSVFKAHNVTKEQFEESVRWYSSHLESWEKVTQNVSIELDKANGR